MDFEQTCSGNEVVVAHSTSHKSIRDINSLRGIDMKKNLDHLEMEHKMVNVFSKAIDKSLLRCEKEGNTSTPWKDFTIEHLDKRLDDEYTEYLEAKTLDELIDIMVMASICYLARQG